MSIVVELAPQPTEFTFSFFKNPVDKFFDAVEKRVKDKVKGNVFTLLKECQEKKSTAPLTDIVKGAMKAEVGLLKDAHNVEKLMADKFVVFIDNIVETFLIGPPNKLLFKVFKREFNNMIRESSSIIAHEVVAMIPK